MAKTESPTRKAETQKDHFLRLSPGKLTGLRQITDVSNKFRVLALDQSNSFKKAIVKLHGLEGVQSDPTYDEIRDAKLLMVEYLGPFASGTLLDVNYGARQALSSFALPKGVGLIVRVEASRDAGLPGEYEPGWGVEKIKKMGASAVKLLVYLDTEDKEGTKAQLAFVQDVSRRCREQDILLMTEELSYPRKGEDKGDAAYQSRKVRNILEATRLLGPHTDILKLEFPGNIKTDPDSKLTENLGRLNESAIRPWVLLSAGEKFELFSKQVELALKAGCSGYMAGRAIFNEFFDQAKEADRMAFLKGTAIRRMETLNLLVERHATPWTARVGTAPADLAKAVDPRWYLEGAKASKSPEAVHGEY